MRIYSFITGEGGYCALAVPEEGPSRAILTAGEASVTATGTAPVEEGRASLSTDEQGIDIEIGWTPAGPFVQFDMGISRVGFNPVAVSGRSGEETLSGPGIAWALPEDGFSAIRTIWAVDSDSSLLVLASVRPEDAREHGEEIVGAGRLTPDHDPYDFSQPLVSTHYGADGSHVRANLELWGDDEETGAMSAAERGSGTRTSGGAMSVNGSHLAVARFAWSFEGKPAVGGYEILTA